MNLRWDDQTAIIGEPVPPVPPRHHLPRRRVFPNGWADAREASIVSFFLSLTVLIITGTLKITGVF